MKLVELFQSDFGENPQKTTHDTLAQLALDDSRKPMITLAKLHTLRKMREFRRFEDLKKKSLLNIMYSTPSNDGGMM